ncbi:hypothetical protein C3747_248g17 [Trypanosoma cruzi]|uniref:Methyltransferase domain-containing protein n=2 Tax=Trypanosoma cruzi TaxID=5693 RepID=Q4DKV5_TRYCC|nr:hypothetical protein, conserved [Trypanosoma cruzi]EAN93139.1 hypothetical protein, conserved [Trypanosoma cruzi]KAF8285835.1 hypothetical protein TcYC6_0032570 [Trypanosoma cruzi]PWU97116.1 hypothetical protein C3747_248g17 [Trypanosoma cruzi]RNC57225.1 hypothetical protein TcCL_ESM05220 [Trypanosoma cruzi]|eukprot:XP_814990.1 hypothetical protein [Trypanosoma cruzi strain CL Brener]
MELPFQWDDGNFISPFLASGDDTLRVLAAWLNDSPLLRFQHGGALRLTDLGCGDGSALLSLSAGLFTLRGASGCRDVSPLQLTAVGLDLDEELILAARRRAEAVIVPPPHRLHCVFETADVRQLDAAQYFPLSESSRHVLFVYLLPEGLEAIREKLLEIISRVALLVSNRWEVPFLARWKRVKLQNLHLYQYVGDGAN